MTVVQAWSDLWPNVVAPSVWTLFGVGLSHWRLRRKQDQHHAAIVEHVTKETSSG